MPLPAALAARLAQRGLIPKVEEKNDDEEEIFAENYDDSTLQQEQQNKAYNPSDSDDDIENVQDQIDLKFKGHPGCPNKSNIYHECSKFCKTKWRDGIKVPDKKYVKKKNKMLSKYPLPQTWKEIYDPGYGRFYYWDMESDNVSWLPPNHPRARITECAAVLKEEVHLAAGDKEDEEEEESSSDDEIDDSDSEDEKTKKEEERKKREQEEKLRREKKKQQREQVQKVRAKGREKKRGNDLDPMDPASYSDIPRGGWSDGLVSEGKTGVDTTASGPLFQQRPYPSPGDILRANKKRKAEEDDDLPPDSP